MALSGCRACQRRTLETFASLAGLSITPSRTPITRRKLASAAIPSSRRRLHTSKPWLQQSQSPQPTETGEATIPASEPSSDAFPSATSQAADEGHIPWYLRVDPPAPIAPQQLPNLAAQEIPPLPEDPPALLQPLLEHLSISLGLDHLSLLDLRSLQPPSPLGTHLLMILGTARSEKHLNTSADRLCRWLRGSYKLRPFADGLLGRNELKLKLRRRNRKMKLAQSVGNTTMFGADGKKDDDGITTGWICCNLGDVSLPEELETQLANERANSETHQMYSPKDQERILDDEEAEYKNPSDDEFKYRGFGSSSTGPRIVVQMFTEPKRLEMDLEGLWENRLKRRDDRALKRDEEFLMQKEEMDEYFETSRIEEEIERPISRDDRGAERPLSAVAAS